VKPDEGGVSALELTIGRVLRLGVLASSILLVVGLLLTLVDIADRVAGILLTTAIVILLATPPARVVISVAEYVREQDWLFVALTLTVLLTLALSVVAAFWNPV
jgi:uncharacterized membrane protein